MMVAGLHVDIALFFPHTVVPYIWGRGGRQIKNFPLVKGKNQRGKEENVANRTLLTIIVYSMKMNWLLTEQDKKSARG